MTDEKEKKPGFWKGLLSRKLNEVKPQEGDSVRSYFSRNTQTLQAGGAIAAGAVIGGVALGARAGVSMFRLMGRFTFIFVILAGGLHWLHITRQVSEPVFTDIFLWMYVMLGVMASIFFWNDRSDPFPVKRTVKFILLAVAAYLFPLILQQLVFYDFINQQLAAFFAIWTPLLVLYAFMDPGDGITRLLAAGYFLLIITLAITQIIFPIVEERAPGGPVVVLFTPDQVIANIKDGLNSVGERVEEAQTTVTTQIKNGTQRVTQEIYTGQVDSSQGLPLGIQLIEPRPIIQRFFVDQGDDVIATATVQARTVNEEPYTVRNTCVLEFTSARPGAASENVRVTGEVNPSTFTIAYTGEQYDRRSIECIIKAEDILAAAGQNAVNVVTGRIVFNTTFEFSTAGYMTYAFMDSNLFNSLRVDNRQPWQELGLPGPMMMAKYTPGPVSIGMPQDTTPYPVDSRAETATLPPFALTFGNAFTGRGGIQSFEETFVYVPRLFTITGDECTPRTIYLTESQEDQNDRTYGSDYRRYTVNNLTRQSNEQFVTVRCPLVMNTATTDNVGDLLGPSGGGIYTLFTTTRYTYAIDTMTTASVTFPRITNTAGAGLFINGYVVDSKAACANSNPYCTGSPNTAGSRCYCFHKDGTTDLGVCAWDWGAGKMDYARAVVDGTDPTKGSCGSSNIPAGCSVGISCSGETCRCVYPVTDDPATTEIERGSRDCTWEVARFGSTVECKQYEETR